MGQNASKVVRRSISVKPGSVPAVERGGRETINATRRRTVRARVLPQRRGGVVTDRCRAVGEIEPIALR